MTDRLRLTGIRKAYGSRMVLDGTTISVAEGEILALLGLSGCGKTTLLNLIAGLDRPDAGEIEMGGRIVAGPRTWIPAHRRGVGMVFQGQVLWPHLSVAGHLEFVLAAAGVPRAERSQRIAAQLEAVQLTGRNRARPAELSGGECQRLAIARALAARPSLLLLDEPCANLDAPLKSELLALLTRLRAVQKFSAVYVTHDSTEAFSVADRIAVMDGGALIQTGTSEELTQRPASAAVARILGSGTLLPGRAVSADQVETALGRLEVASHGYALETQLRVLIRAGDLKVNGSGPLQALARASYFDGQTWIVVLEAGGELLRCRTEGPAAAGQPVQLSLLRAPTVFR